MPRLEHSLGLLTGGGRDLPDRQQTLRATIAWSYDLLTEGARRLLAACSVFAGGASLEVIETVCDAAVDIGLPVLDGLAGAGRPEPAAAGAQPWAVAGALRDAGDDPRVRGRAPGRRCRRRSGPAALMPRLSWPWSRPAAARRRAWPRRNGWSGSTPSTTTSARRSAGTAEHDPPAALRLAASMSAFWSLRGHHTEGRQRLGELLGLVPEPSMARVSALNGAAWLAIDQGDYAHAAGLLGESIGLSRALGDTVGEGIATVYLGRCKMSSVRIAEGAPDVERAVALVNEAGDRPAIAFTHVLLRPGRAAHRPAWKPPATCSTAARAMAAELGLAPLSARARQMLGFPLLDLGELSAARTALAEGFPMSTDVGDRWFVQLGLGGFVGLAAKTGRPRLALRLAGAADAYRDANEFSMPGPIGGDRRPLARADAGQGRASGRAAARGGPEAEPGGGGRSGPGERAGRRPAAGLPADADPAGGRGRGARGARADQPGHRRAAVPLGPDRRGARRPHPHQAGFPHPDPAGRLGPRGRPAAEKIRSTYVILQMARGPRPAPELAA